MKTVVQVVKKASVTVNGKIVSEIGEGLLLFVGFSPEDNSETMKKTIDKTMGLRIFADGNGKTNLPFNRDRQEVLCVSQFTLTRISGTESDLRSLRACALKRPKFCTKTRWII